VSRALAAPYATSHGSNSASVQPRVASGREEDTLKDFAEITGGKLSTTRMIWRRVSNALTDDAASYYVLGYYLDTRTTVLDGAN